MKESNIEIEEVNGEIGPAFVIFGEEIVPELVERDFEIYNSPAKIPVTLVKTLEPNVLVVGDGDGSVDDYTYPQETVKFFFQKIPIVGVGVGQRIVVEALDGEVENGEIVEAGALSEETYNAKPTGVFTFAELSDDVITKIHHLSIHFDMQEEKYWNETRHSQ